MVSFLSQIQTNLLLSLFFSSQSSIVPSFPPPFFPFMFFILLHYIVILFIPSSSFCPMPLSLIIASLTFFLLSCLLSPSFSPFFYPPTVFLLLLSSLPSPSSSLLLPRSLTLTSPCLFYSLNISFAIETSDTTKGNSTRCCFHTTMQQ